MAPLTSLQRACELVREQVRANPLEERALSATRGMVLGEDVLAVTDAPPYDKSLVDGYAVIASDLAGGIRRLSVVQSVMAGQVPQHALRTGEAARIMTGGMMPAGGDAVVMIEQTRGGGTGDGTGDTWVEIETSEIVPGQNIMRRGVAMRAGQRVLSRGRRMRAVDVGLLAEAGRSHARVVRPPRVALIPTGDELIDVGQPLEPGQIRNSNGPLLGAMVCQANAELRDLGIVRDQPDRLAAAVAQGLAEDVLVLCGGVSKGDRDWVPMILEQAGVECIFHGVDLRPGKPLWFGARRYNGRTTLVFGLPGNPMSSLVCFRLFVSPTLDALAGRPPSWDWHAQPGQLSRAFAVGGSRPTFWPGRREDSSGRVEPLEWKGSADPFVLAHSDCLIFFDPGGREYQAGETVQVIDLVG